ncbi:MAG: CYTH domain-containing protein [Bacteroidaceae bacterium]|nr:CYTH domain-containing protein [Bacteroidaceae bacterium]
MEIERKFLVNDDSYKSLAYNRSEILQGYICRQNGRTVRVRLRDDKGYLTIKGPSDASGIARFEWEKEIPLEEARQLLSICQPGRIEKTRWLVKAGKHVVEVDEFHGDNDGLVFAEIELGAVDEPYEKPAFLGKEVTGDHRYYNGFISRNPYNTWEKE